MHVAGFVLAGGRSCRMGQDKALLEWRSGSLVERLAECVKEAAGNVALIGNPELYSGFGFDCLADLRPARGPLAGIETALASGRGELNLIAACDMPGLEVQWLKMLLQEADESGAECVATRDASGRLHPLCAVYRDTCLVKVQKALDAGRLKALDALDELDTVVLETGQMLWNVNTPE
jgi:molybdopterin-guanine dinucleotide biosynthesis protein A